MLAVSAGGASRSSVSVVETGADSSGKEDGRSPAEFWEDGISSAGDCDGVFVKRGGDRHSETTGTMPCEEF
jgi:hypothetical protein